MTQRPAAALLAAGFAALILSTHTFSSARLARAVLVDAPQPPRDNFVRATTARAPLAETLESPFAVIAAVDAPAPVSITVSIDGRVVCERAVRPRSGRIDCDFRGEWNQSVPHDVTVRSEKTNWTLRSLELATQHGHTSGANYFLFLPIGAKSLTRPDPWVVAVVCLGIGVLFALPWPPPLPRAIRYVHGVVAAVMLFLLLTIQLSNLVSPYFVAVSGGTLARWSLWLLLPWIWRGARWLLLPAPVAAGRSAWARPVVIGAAVLMAYSAVVTARVDEYFGGNYSGLLSISRDFFDHNPLLANRADVRNAVVLQEHGYDGQFMYFAMFDPLMRRLASTPWLYRGVADAPPYRYGRIGFPLLALVASRGYWPRFPVAMTWLVVCGIGAFAMLLARIAQDAGQTAALGGLAILIPGFWSSAQTTLPEPIAAAFLLGGIMLAARSRWLSASGAFAASLLTRETGVVAVGCFLAAEAVRHKRREAWWAGVLAVSVVVAWRCYVAWVLYPDWGLRGLLFHPPDLGLPWQGVADLWRRVAAGQYYPTVPEMSRAAITYPVLLTYGFGLAIALMVTRPHAWHAAAVTYGLVAVSLNLPAIWIHVVNAQRGTFELFVMLALATTEIRRCGPRLQSLCFGFWVLSGVYVFLLGYNAGYIRDVLTFI